MGADEKEKKENTYGSSVQENLKGLSAGQRGQFLSLVTEYEWILAKNTSDLGKSDLLEHEIYTGDCQPIKLPHVGVPAGGH